VWCGVHDGLPAQVNPEEKARPGFKLEL
jgi:hypothetical protein